MALRFPWHTALCFPNTIDGTVSDWVYKRVLEPLTPLLILTTQNFLLGCGANQCWPGIEKDVFLIGPGLIGLEVIHRPLENGYNVNALVRRKPAAEKLENLGVKTVLGTLDDVDVIEQHSAASNIVIHTATADHLPSVEAVIRGIDRRAKEDKQTIFIHTSGCTFLSDDSNGEFKSETVYSDKDPATLDARPETSSHREIDLTIIRARQR